MKTFFKLTGALFSWGHVFFFRLSDEKCQKFILLKEPTSSLLAYTHRRPWLTERKRTVSTLRERNAVCETKSGALHVQANSYTTFSETWLSSPSVWKCCVANFLFHEGIYKEKRIRNVLLFSLHNRPKHIQLLPFIFSTYRTEHVFIELLIVPYYSST